MGTIVPAGADDLGEPLEVDVAARDDGDDFLVAARSHCGRDCGGDGAGRRAFGDDVDAIGDQPHRPRGVVERYDERFGHPRLEEGPHRSEDGAAAGAVHERGAPRVERAGAANDVASGAAVSGSAA